MKQLMIYVACMAIALTTTSCDYEYLTDGGEHDPHVDMTTYDFLATHSWRSFDTLIMLIDHNDMRNEFNSAATAVVPTDYSIKLYMNSHFGWTLDSLKKHVTADTLRSYLFDVPTTFEDLDTSEETVLASKSGRSFKFVMEEQTDFTYTEWTDTPVYRLVFSRNDTQFNYAQTSNIQTNTGVVHALENRHVFNFGY